MKNSINLVKYINENLEKLIVPEGNLELGHKYPYKIGEKGAVMELLPEGHYFIKLVVDGLDEFDITEFRENDITFKTLFNRDKSYMLIRFGNSSLLHEIVFNPTLYKNKLKTKENLNKSNLIYCVLIEGLTEQVQGIKIFNFPLELFEKLTIVWKKALNNPNYTEEFQAYITNFFSEDIVYWWENIN